LLLTTYRINIAVQELHPKAFPKSSQLPLSAVSGVLAGHAIPHETPQQQPQGPLVAPGVYTVELLSGNKTERQQITVQVDPRVHASEADLDDQLKLAQRILGGVATSYREYQSAAALYTALEEGQLAATGDRAA
jgi:hypothetical protein